MKARTGLVSNSSSSSFIIGFSKKPKIIDELKTLLFRELEIFVHPFTDKDISTHTMAEIVFNDIKDQKPATMEEMLQEIEQAHIKGQPKYDDFITADYKTEKYEYDIQRKEYMNLIKEFYNEELKTFLINKIDLDFFIVEYSDNDGDMDSCMEHGDIFAMIPHYRISKH